MSNKRKANLINMKLVTNSVTNVGGDEKIDIARIEASSLNIQRSLGPAPEQKIIYATVKSSRTVS